jgi:hypothetical protein
MTGGARQSSHSTGVLLEFLTFLKVALNLITVPLTEINTSLNLWDEFYSPAEIIMIDLDDGRLEVARRAIAIRSTKWLSGISRVPRDPAVPDLDVGTLNSLCDSGPASSPIRLKW